MAKISQERLDRYRKRAAKDLWDIDHDRTIQIGMRGRGLYRCEFSQASGMRMIKVEEFKKLGVERVVEEARHIVGDGPVYLHF